MVSIQKLGLLLSLVSTSVFAQEGLTTGPVPGARRNVLTVSVPVSAQSRVELNGEHVLSDRVSVGLGVFVSLYKYHRQYDNVPVDELGEQNARYFQAGLAPAMRFYLTGTAPQGLWVSPRLDVGYGRDSNKTVGSAAVNQAFNENHYESWFLGGAGALGYSMVLESGFTVQAGVGLGARREFSSAEYRSQDLQGRTSIHKSEDKSWALTQQLLLNLGWAF
ncbi:DUF3575 domain-containing protein [Corallococcus sp. CA047B]|uniref:DUF3575 domain-containing protein n=1 Tax=Corallococcus sp. CA047B TaxID=2316729 RepID=UPI000EA048D9|nr:DUF3575 domain-containing protein [Corallococcus sp. CA047B]RKH20429.1 DUF3575 domain-containing protein [Corallococcus sp. CA047B]